MFDALDLDATPDSIDAVITCSPALRHLHRAREKTLDEVLADMLAEAERQDALVDQWGGW